MPSLAACRRFFQAGLLLAALGVTNAALAAPAGQPTAALPGIRIVAVVNGDIISNTDVDNRARLFALSTGLPLATGVVERLRSQITRQLIDERLRIQETQRRRIVVADRDIAAAIFEIEQRNGMPRGMLRQKLAVDGVSQRTLIDQLRSQIGWTQVLKEQLADKINISDTDVDSQLRLLAQQTGKQEFRVGEIFVPVDDPANVADARRFVETVIQELRAGAPFAMVAAQFSQTQSALEGGELGWVQVNQLDPEVGRLVTSMPIGAISNPVRVPGGFSVVTLYGRREAGRDGGTAVNIRQVFLPFTSALNPQAPTDQQRQALEKAQRLSGSLRGCEQVEQAAQANPSPRPVDPGEIRLEAVNPPQFRQLLGSLPLGTVSQPLVAPDGVVLLAVCARTPKTHFAPSRPEIQRMLINERVELLSRQMLRDLRRQSTIDLRPQGV